MRKPYFRKRRQIWCVKDSQGKEVNLGPDEEKAFDTWRRMLDAQSDISNLSSFRRLTFEFLDLHYEDRPKFKQDAARITSFASYLKDKPARDVSKRDVIEWLNAPKFGPQRKDGSSAKRKWGARTKRDAYSAISKVYRWAVNAGHLATNPIAGLKLEASEPRSSVITPDQQRRILEECDSAFRLYLQACSCGPRPRQVREVEASNVLDDYSAWVFTQHKTRHKTSRPLVVYLSPCLQTITKILTAARPNGPLFLNSQGNPWKKDTVGQKFRRIRDKLKLPKDIVNYSYRHTFATDALLSDVPIQTVSELLGHSDTRMVSQVYGHLDKHRHYLSEAAAKVKKRQ